MENRKIHTSGNVLRAQHLCGIEGKEHDEFQWCRVRFDSQEVHFIN